MTRRLNPGAAAEASPPDIGWQESAACRGHDPELFFAPDVERTADRQRREAKAKRICAGCIVRVPCLEWRLADAHQFDGGVWAGLNENERWKVRKNRVRAEAARKRVAA